MGPLNRISIIFIVGFILGSAAVAPAADLVVRADGTGKYATIQAAIQAAVAGDNIVLDKGTYQGTGNVNIDPMGKAITIRSLDTSDLATITQTILNGKGTDRIFNFKGGETNTCVVAGLTITNGQGDYGGGISIQSGSSPKIENCIISGNKSSRRGGGIFCSGAGTNPSLLNTYIIGNQAVEGGGGLYCAEGSNPTIRNDTFYGNTGGQRGGAVNCYGATATILNTLMWANTGSAGAQISVQSSGNVSITYSDVQGGSNGIERESGSTASWNSATCIDANPKFVAVGTDLSTGWDDKLHLDKDSPCIDKGDLKLDYPYQLDIDGDLRYYNGRTDIGADEWPHWEWLTVDTTPVKGMVFVDDDACPSWGMAPQSKMVTVGQHIVIFGDVAGYVKPANKLITLVKKGQPLTIAGEYTVYVPPTTGTLSVDTTPVKGDILVDGASWGVAPQSKVIPVGSHTLSFGEVAGYTRPADQTIQVTEGQTTEATGTYTPFIYPENTGTLEINTTPVKGEIFVDGESWGTGPQSKVVATGSHTLRFGPIEGYTPPMEQTISVVQSQITHFLGTYTLGTAPADTGTLTVDTVPVKAEVFVDGQSWGAAPQSQVIINGAHTISFGDVPGYVKPENQSVVITQGHLTQVTGTYYLPLTLKINSSPVQGEVFIDGTSWGTTPISREFKAGQYVISFGNIDGYTRPADQTVTLAWGETKEIEGVYVSNSAPDTGTPSEGGGGRGGCAGPGLVTIGAALLMGLALAGSRFKKTL